MKMTSVTTKVHLVLHLTSLTLLTARLPAANSISQKSFTFKWTNGTYLQFSYPRYKYGDCIYDSLRDWTTCMKNHPYDDITSAWRSSPENVSYIAVNCLQQRMYADNHRQCICKDRSMAAHPHKRTQSDSYRFCQLDAIGPFILDSLANLEVLDLGHNHLFRIPRDSFRKTKKLKMLTLSNNPIESFFNGVLCDVQSLEILILQDMPMKYFPQTLFDCGVDFVSSVKVIDASHSKISTIAEGDFHHLSHLGLLDLSYNALSDLKEEPFVGLTSLELLDLSGNQLSSLPGSFCSDLTKLKRLIVKDNDLTSFNCTTFEMCTRLHLIDMSHGKISVIDGYPCRLTSLKNLDLSHNQMLHMPAKLLHNESVIERLDLSQNRLLSVDVEAFHDMSNLVFLNLSFNNFLVIDETFLESSKHLNNMEVLDLKGNDIWSVSDYSFKHLGSLTDLYLSDNLLSKVNTSTFTGIEKIEKLYLNNNNISVIAKAAFTSMHSLAELDLSNNGVRNMNIEFPSSLKVLNMDNNNIDKVLMVNQLLKLDRFYVKGNNITRLNKNDFHNMTNLRILDISENHLTSISDNCFRFLPQLETLNLSNNNLQLNMSEKVFSGLLRIRELDLSHNVIGDVEGMFDEGSLASLEHLDLAFNSITSIKTTLNNQNSTIALKWINLESCKIRYVSLTAFSNLDRLEYVNLQNNMITFMPLFEARLGAMFYFKGNPLICSCGMVWILQRWLDTDSTGKMSTYDYDVDVCEVYPTRKLRKVRKLSSVEFLCPVKTACPDACSCYVLTEGGSIYMTVCRGNLTEVPEGLPADSEFMYLDGNKFGSLGVFSKVSHYTERLFLNSSGITELKASVFSVFDHVSHIDISFNTLKTLPSTIFDGLDNLIDVNMKHNGLTHLPKGLFSNVPNLQNIDISHNKMHYIAAETLMELDHLSTFRWIRLAGNPLLCSCPNYDFRQWMEKSYNRVYDKRNVLCEGEEIRRVSEERFTCEDSLSASLRTAIVVICVIAAILPVIIMLVYCRREMIAVCYTRVVPLFTRQPERHHHHTDPHYYDAVVLYDTSDPKCSWWVQKSLLPKLTEGRRKYKLYIPHGESSDTAVFCIQKSRCTIALVTNTFQQNRFALDCFRHSVTQEINNDNDHHVIVVTWGFIDKKNLPSCLKHFMEHTRVLPVTTAFFWDKLIQRLPNTLNRDRVSVRGEVNAAFDYGEDRF